MNFSYSVNINSNFATKQKNVGNAKAIKMTPQQEYWLDRILRNHSGQIFFVVVLFLLIILGTVIASVIYGENTNKPTTGQLIEMKSGNSVIRIQN